MDDQLHPPRNIALVAAIFEGGLAVAAVGIGWITGRDALDSLPDTTDGVVKGLGYGLLATLPPLLLMWGCLKWPVGPIRGLVHLVDTLLVPMFRQCNLLELAVISLLAGLGEEMLFRSIVQQGVADGVGGTHGVWIGLVAAAVLFGLIHGITPMYALLATAIGFYLGGLWIATENLLVPITAHAVYDFAVFVYLVRWRPIP
ncbi:MAG: CPBP family intramembrane metalloprotease [Candidatus Nealsonbacteria bacterium]|nr:CPBP family intramembrane metalloprotease [Candidatus Nealsonbacteria bacterium]